MLMVLLLAQLASASPPPTRFELPNGLRVWIQEDHSRPVALVHVTYHAGSLNEAAGVTGVAHYVEHMVYRATENIRNEDVYGYIDRIGGRYTGGTWPNATRYAETVPSWALESALRVTAERMTRAVFDSLEFERERSNIVTEAHGFADTDPASKMRDAVMMAAFEVHPYRYSSNTWARDNLKLTRAQAYAWYKQHYGPNNAVLVIVGDVNTNEARRLVEKHFAPLARAPGNGRVDILEPPQLAEKRITMRAPADSALLVIAYRVPGTDHPDFPAMVRFNQVFAPRVQAAVGAAHPGVRVETHDSAMAYPHLYRIEAVGERHVDMIAVLATIDRTLSKFWARSVEVMGDTVPMAHAESTARPETQGLGPQRRSNLTRIAESLAAREAPGWEVSSSERDSIAARARRVTPLEFTGFSHTWLVPYQRTVGILSAAGTQRWTEQIDVPAMTTPPAKRQQPEAVPREALQPLKPVAIARTRRTLQNGVSMRAARAPHDGILLRVVVQRRRSSDTLVRTIPLATRDSAMRSAVADLRAMLARSRTAPKDSSTEDRARAIVVAALSPGEDDAVDASAPVSVALVGPLSPDELVALGARHFSALPPRRPFSGRRHENRTDGMMMFAPPASGREKQVEIVFGLPGVHRDHPDRRALELLNYIVGVPYYGGRLGWALTKSGLTYSSSAQTTFGEEGRILFTTTADTRNTMAVMQAIGEVVAGVGARGVERWELEEAQAFMLGRTLLYGAREDSPAAVVAAALTDSDAAAMDLLDLPAVSRAYLAVSHEEINRVARAFYRDNLLVRVAAGAVPETRLRSPFPPGTFAALFEP